MTLVLSPLAAALAAGNCVLIKPSELAPATGALITELMRRYLDPSAVRVLGGGAEVAQELLQFRWDHILFTGGGRVGRLVAAKAAETLTPVTLELGGKNPVYVDRSASLPLSAKRIALAKIMNLGQVCVCPDYVLAHADVAEPLARAIADVWRSWFGDDEAAWSGSDALGRLINAPQWRRVAGLLEGHGGQLLCGGLRHADEAARFMPPTVVLDPSAASALMREEIFGPVLPVLPVCGPAEAVDFIRSREKPLAVYVFSTDDATTQQLLEGTSSGLAVVNDCGDAMANQNAPFGGVGASGYGRYNGRFGFAEFSHTKPITHRSLWLDSAGRYPPAHSEKAVDQLRFLTKSVLPNGGKIKALLTGLAAGGAFHRYHSRL